MRWPNRPQNTKNKTENSQTSFEKMSTQTNEIKVKEPLKMDSIREVHTNAHIVCMPTAKTHWDKKATSKHWSLVHTAEVRRARRRWWKLIVNEKTSLVSENCVSNENEIEKNCQSIQIVICKWTNFHYLPKINSLCRMIQSNLSLAFHYHFGCFAYYVMAWKLCLLCSWADWIRNFKLLVNVVVDFII